MKSSLLTRFSPGQLALISLASVILGGTFLLWLPAARTTSISFIDLLFTATSTTCVTGLFTIPLENFTPLGHLILMFLMQIGGLGIITMTLMFLSPFVEFGLSTQMLAGHLLDLESRKNVRRLLLFIMSVTLVSELVGALALLWFMIGHLPLRSAVFNSFFHAVSSFCNAGIALPGEHLTLYESTPALLIITSILSLLGGLGFITWLELIEKTYARYQGHRRRLSLHSKIILWGTLAIVSVTTIAFFVLERQHTLALFNTPTALLYAFFQATMSRTAGFILLAPYQLQSATLMVIMAASFIGMSPLSTGSGVRVTTMAVVLSMIRAALAGKTMVEIKERRIAQDQVLRAVATVLLGLGGIFFVTWCLLITELHQSFFNLFFETWNAFTNLGLSMGQPVTTMLLSTKSKMLIIGSMITGRIGSFSLIMGLRVIKRQDSVEYTYPEERIML